MDIGVAGQENFPIHCQSSAVVTPFERSSSGSGSEPEISASIQGPTLLDHRESFHLPLQSSGSSVDWPAGCFVETKGLNPGHLEKCELMPARGGGLEGMRTGLLEQVWITLHLLTHLALSVVVNIYISSDSSPFLVVMACL